MSSSSTGSMDNPLIYDKRKARDVRIKRNLIGSARLGRLQELLLWSSARRMLPKRLLVALYRKALHLNSLQLLLLLPSFSILVLLPADILVFFLLVKILLDVARISPTATCKEGKLFKGRMVWSFR